MKDIAFISRKTKDEKGFTLIETIVAISILSIGLLAVASLQVSAIHGNAFAAGITEATTLALDRMELLMTLDYDDADMDDTNGDGTAGLNKDTTGAADQERSYNSDNGVLYNIYWNTVRDVPVLNTTTIKVIVKWGDKGVQRRVNLDFIRGNI